MIWLILAVMVWLVIALLVLSYRYAWWRASVSLDHPRILMYHMISSAVPKAKFNKMRVAPCMFEMQLQWLVSQDFIFVTMSELYTRFHKKQSLYKTIVMTFDDGYADNFYQALPLLKRYGAKATVYVVVDRHNRDWNVYKKAHHNSGELMREAKLSDADVLEMVNSGLIEIASHSQTHAKLISCDISTKQTEINESRKALQQLTQQTIEGFCYPFGLFDKMDQQIAQQSGYLHAVTTHLGIDDFTVPIDWFALKRIKISGKDSLFDFRTRIRTGFKGWRRA